MDELAKGQELESGLIIVSPRAGINMRSATLLLSGMLVLLGASPTLSHAGERTAAEKAAAVAVSRRTFPWLTDLAIANTVAAHSAKPEVVRDTMIGVQFGANTDGVSTQLEKGGLLVNAVPVWWSLISSQWLTKQVLTIWEDPEHVWKSTGDVPNGPKLEPTATITFYEDRWELKDSGGLSSGKVIPSEKPFPDFSKRHTGELLEPAR
jgi:hypothetical protein